MSAPQHVYEIYIRATPERLWQAITDPTMTPIYYFGSLIESDLTVGSPLRYRQADGRLDIDGEVLEVDPPRRLVHSFAIRYDPDIDEPPTTVTWLITPMGDEACLLSLTHSGFATENRTFAQIQGGWAKILSGLKTLVETGEPLRIQPPVDEAQAVGA
jgi:uncharacterized protein YndB with AHSA1/START domain